MADDNNAKLSLLHDHYKDSFAHLRTYVKLRDLFFMYLLAGLFFLFLDIKPSDDSATMLSRFLSSHAGIEVLKPHYLRALLWFLLLFLVIRYSQTTLLIERQYPYIHRLESELNKHFGESVFDREGKQYFKNYPLFGDWAHFLYGWAFPILLILAVSAKLILEWRFAATGSFPLIVDSVLFAMIVISVVLHLIALHRKSER